MNSHMMLRKFECRGFKGFKDWISFDLQVSDYPLNKGIIKNGVVNKALIYGRNGSGKSNLGIAIFDLVRHLTDRSSLNRPIYRITCVSTGKQVRPLSAMPSNSAIAKSSTNTQRRIPIISSMRNYGPMVGC